MQLAGRTILVGSYSITAPVEEQIMLFSSLALTEQVRFCQLNFSPVGFVFFLFPATWLLQSRWLKSRTGCSVESCLVTHQFWKRSLITGEILLLSVHIQFCGTSCPCKVMNTAICVFMLEEDISSLFNTGLLALSCMWKAVGFTVQYRQTTRNWDVKMVINSVEC